ncbi:MAG: endopeptidase La, partial [bacterium]|nr:endopeptidase La [bacterium]
MIHDDATDAEAIDIITDRALANIDQVLPNEMHLLPVATRPFFPGQAVPLLMDPDHWMATIIAARDENDGIIGIVMSDAETSETSKAKDLRKIGTTCRIHRVQRVEGRLQVLVECLRRMRIDRLTHKTVPFKARVSYFPEPKESLRDDVKAYAMAIINTIKELVPLNPLYGEELRIFLDRLGPDDPSHLADFAASLSTADRFQLQEVLQAVELMPRMEKVLVLLNKELELAKAQHEIRRS